MIALNKVSKSYGGRAVLTDVTAHIAPKQFLCIVGAAGSGKTTIVRLLTRAEDPTSGTITVDGADLKMLPTELLQLYRQRAGVISSALPLVDNWTVTENVAYPLLARGVDETARIKRVAEVLKRLDLQSRAGQLAGKLSGGERGLVLLARAIVAQPAVLIADEPTHDLSEAQAKLVMAVLSEAHKRGTTVALLTRDKDLVPPQAIVLQLKDGTCVAPAAHRKMHEKSTETTMDLPKQSEPTVIAKKPETHHRTAPTKPGRKVRITSIGSDLG